MLARVLANLPYLHIQVEADVEIPPCLHPTILSDQIVILSFDSIVLSVPPEVTLPYQQITQHSGKDTLLECMISANPLTTHHWEREGVPIQV